MTSVDIIVVGRGPAGLTAAAALARTGLRLALVGPTRAVTDGQDARTAALFRGSLALLRNIGAWERLAVATAPLNGIRIIDDSERLLRAPDVTFEARELGLDDFGANVPQDALAQVLLQAVTDLGNVHSVDASVTGIEQRLDNVAVTLNSGSTITAALVVAADGRNSACRRAAGIEMQSWDYPQIAIAAQFSHARPHHGISTEFHRPAGPCTVVPLPGRRSSLVWVERPAIAKRLGSLDDEAFATALQERLHGLLGAVSEPGPRRMFPLGGLKAATLAARRVVLVGEAGHTLPPIGAQGLNLGFRDAAVLAELVAAAYQDGEDVGGDQVLDAYDTARRGDVAMRTAAVDLLNRSLLADLLPGHLARGLALHMMGTFGALKRQVMRAGFEPVGALPELMRSARPS